MQPELRPSADAIRASYLEQDNLDRVDRADDLLRSVGFSVGRDTETGEISTLHWEHMEQDFDTLDDIFMIISEATELNKEEFAAQVLPRIQQLALGFDNHHGSYLLRGLNNPEIKTSGAHTKTPFGHTLEVFEHLESDGLTPGQVDWSRFSAMGHDLGKLAIADGDYFQDHAELSYLMMREYCRSRTGLSAQEIEDFLAPIRYHHTFELVDKGILTVEDVRALVSSDQALVVLATLSFADVQSVGEQYQLFALNHGVVALELFAHEIEEASQDIQAWFEAFSGAYLHFAANLQVEPSDKSHQYVHGIQERAERALQVPATATLSQALNHVFAPHSTREPAMVH